MFFLIYNFLKKYNFYLGFINLLAKNKIDLSNNCNVLQGYIALWRCLIFISSTIVISTFKEIHIQEFFEFLGQNEYNIELIKLSNKDNIIDTIIDTTSAPLYTFLLQIFCAFIIYQVGKVYIFITNMIIINYIYSNNFFYFILYNSKNCLIPLQQ